MLFRSGSVHVESLHIKSTCKPRSRPPRSTVQTQKQPRRPGTPETGPGAPALVWLARSRWGPWETSFPGIRSVAQEMEQARGLWSMVWLRWSRSAGSGFCLAQARQREARRPQHRPAAQQTARGSDLMGPRLSAHLPAWTPATSVLGRPPRLRCPEPSAGLRALDRKSTRLNSSH